MAAFKKGICSGRPGLWLRLVPLLFGMLFLCVPAAFAQRGIKQVQIDIGGKSDVSQSIVLPLNKTAMVDLPYPVADIMIARTSVVEAVIHTPERVQLIGMSAGQTNAFFYDSRNRLVLNLEIRVDHDVEVLNEMISRIIPESRVTAEVINGNIVLQGVVQSASRAADVEALAIRYAGSEDMVLNMLTVRDRAQVMLKVRILEMQRQLTKQLGIDLGGTFVMDNSAFAFAAQNAVSAAAGLGAGSSYVFTDADGTSGRQVDTAMQAFESSGLARILAEPNLTALSGESAKFMAGGEFPVPVGQEEGVITIEFKPFGVGLGFSPVVLDRGRINLKISTEVSEITFVNSFELSSSVTDDGTSVASFTIPGVSIRRADTVVELPSGGSLMLAGLLQENLNSEIGGIPYAKDVPVLGSLFRSQEFQNDESELVIIVTPYLVDSVHESDLRDPGEGIVPATTVQTLLFGKLVSAYGLAGTGAGDEMPTGPMGFIID